MTLYDLRLLLAKYTAQFHPADLGDENDYHPPPCVDYRVTATGGLKVGRSTSRWRTRRS